MYITEIATGVRHTIEITSVIRNDLRRITVKQHIFRWRPLLESCELYKLTMLGGDKILGLMALVPHEDEQRMEIKLLTSSKENIGRSKEFDRIAGCLIAFAAKEALDRFERFPAISLLPKTNLKQHYINQYGMEDAGLQVYLEDIGLFNVINTYLT